MNSKSCKILHLGSSAPFPITSLLSCVITKAEQVATVTLSCTGAAGERTDARCTLSKLPVVNVSTSY